jgi:uncharacterized protein (TIGR02266 family)
MPRCAACGKTLPENVKFCGYCGFRLAPMPGTDLDIAPDVVTAPGGILDEEDLGHARTIRADLTPSGRHAPPDSGECLPQQSQRKFDRFPMRVDVNYSSAHNFLSAEAENISLGGIFIATFRVEPVGQLLNVTFTVPGLSKPCTVPCEVRWHRLRGEVPGAEPGMGLRFLYLDPAARAAIEAFITHREPIKRGD